MKNLFIALVVTLVCPFVLADNPATLSQKMDSPDKRFTIVIGGAVNDCRLLITNNSNRQTDDSVMLLGLPKKVKWASDSKSIILVQHIAGGSVASVVHFSKGQWTETDVEPPGESPSTFNVRNIELAKEGSIQLEYDVTYDKGHGTWGDRTLIKFDYDPSTGSITNIQHQAPGK